MQLRNVIFSLLAIGSFVRGQEVARPTFSDFLITDTMVTSKPQLDVKSHPFARRYRTALQYALAKGPNFAGSFVLTTLGCGTNCFSVAVINPRTGRVYIHAETAYSDIEFHRNSGLVIWSPLDSLAAGTDTTSLPVWMYRRYFSWDGRALTEIVRARSPDYRVR